jgi:hypothetical protein
MRPHSAPDENVMTFKAWVAGLLVGTLVLTFVASQFNLLLGVERERKVVVVERKIHSKRWTIVMRAEDGKEYEYTINTLSKKLFNPGKGDEVTIRTDGLFWNRVVAGDTGKGMIDLP